LELDLDLGFGVSHLGFEFWGLAFKVCSLEFEVCGFRVRVWSLRFGVFRFHVKVLSLSFGVWGLRFGIWVGGQTLYYKSQIKKKINLKP
jgi:hypothetical protein